MASGVKREGGGHLSRNTCVSLMSDCIVLEEDMQQKCERVTCAHAAYRKCERSLQSRKTTEAWKEVNKPDREALKRHDSCLVQPG